MLWGKLETLKQSPREASNAVKCAGGHRTTRSHPSLGRPRVPTPMATFKRGKDRFSFNDVRIKGLLICMNTVTAMSSQTWRRGHFLVQQVLHHTLMRWKMTLRVISVWLFISSGHPSAKVVFGSNKKQTTVCTGNERQLTVLMVFTYSRSGAVDLGPINKNASPCFRCAKESLIFEKQGLFLP